MVPLVVRHDNVARVVQIMPKIHGLRTGDQNQILALLEVVHDESTLVGRRIGVGNDRRDAKPRTKRVHEPLIVLQGTEHDGLLAPIRDLF